MKSKNFLPYLLPVRCLFFLCFFVSASFIVGKKIDEISNWWSVTASVANILTIMMLVFVCRKRNLTFKKLINFKKNSTSVKQILIVSIVIVVIGMGGMYLAGYICYGVIPYAAPMMIAPIPAWLSVVNFFVLPVTTALAEDGLYLGCGVNQIENKYVAIFVPSFFFALQHSFIPVLFDFTYISYRFLSFLPLTLILCWYYYKKRNPLPIMIGHAVIDVATVSQICMTSMIPEFYDMMCAM